MEPIEVAIVEDDTASREGLSLLIEQSPGFRCQRAFGSVEDALKAPPAPAPDVLLLDINLPGITGTDGVRLLQSKHPRCAILMLTVFDDQDRIFESICNGACGYLLKKTPLHKLLEAIAEVHGGGAPMSPEIARKLVNLFRQGRAPPPVTKGALTEQQVRIVALLAAGHSYASSAQQLGITINTVRNHVRDIYDALHVHSKSAAVSRAIKQGLI